MKTKYAFGILIIGIYSSWFLSFLVQLILSFVGPEYPDASWYLLMASILAFLSGRVLDKYMDINKLALIEMVLLALNIVMVICAVGSFVLTFSPFDFPKDIRYFSLALGLPSILAIFCWKLRKNRD